MKFKKTLLTLGSVTAVVAPIVAVVSCTDADLQSRREIDKIEYKKIQVASKTETGVPTYKWYRIDYRVEGYGRMGSQVAFEITEKLYNENKDKPQAKA